MLYVHSDTRYGGPAYQYDKVVIKDTENADFCIELPFAKLLGHLREHGIMPQTVVGLFVDGSMFLITPVHQVELQVMKQLTNPRFFVDDKLGKQGASAYKSYGLYNFQIESDGFFGTSNYKGRSVARLLLETCGEDVDKGTGDWRIETTKDYIAVCVDNTSYQTVFLRFDIESYSKLQRAFMKYKMLNLGDVAPKTFAIEVQSE